MQMQQWKPEAIRYMQRAAAFSGYYERLAGHILPHLSTSDRICDAGCGMGQLSLALSPSVEAVTAVDRNPDAIAQLSREVADLGIRNIDARCEDIREWVPEGRLDAIIFCLFGGIEEVLAISGRLRPGRVILIHRHTDDALFSRDQSRRRTAAEVLTERGVDFRHSLLSLDLDQPLRDLADARRFFRMYRPEDDLTDGELLSRLRPIGQDAYRYVYPVTRHMEMLVWNE